MPNQAIPEKTSSKRIVVHIVKGRLAGMRKIIGHLVINAEDVEKFPPSIPNVDLGDHAADVIHTGTFERFVLYKEWAKPFSQTYGKQLKDNFDPRQA